MDEFRLIAIATLTTSGSIKDVEELAKYCSEGWYIWRADPIDVGMLYFLKKKHF